MSDLISRQSAINALYHHLPHMTREECAAILHEVGDVETVRKRGEWNMTIDTDEQLYECSVCGGRMFAKSYDHAVGTEGFNFCPYCGAEMRR